MNNSYRRHKKMLDEKHQQLVKSLNALIKAFTQNNEHAVKSHTEKANAMTTALMDSLAVEDQPVWLRSIHSYSNARTAQSISKHDIDQIYPFLQNARSHDWDVEKAAIDFDEIYNRYRDEHDLPGLLENVVNILQKIHDSEEIDSRKIIEALEQLVRMLNSGAKGSYLSLNGALTFTKSLLGNFLWEALSEIPGIGSLVRALRSSLEELDKGVVKTHQDMNKAIAQQTNEMRCMPSIPYNLVYDHEGIVPALPKSSTVDEIA